MNPSVEAEIFSKIIAYQDQADLPRLTLKPSNKLQRSIESRWQAILQVNPGVEDPGDVFKILVQDLFDELTDNPSELLLAHWSSFLCDIALVVSNSIFKIVSMQRSHSCLLDIQSICIRAFGKPQQFFGGFNLKSSRKSNLLESLQAYSYRTIKYSAYPAIRKEFGDPNIGRSNLGLFNHYSGAVVLDALLRMGLEPAQQEQYLALCRCAKEYLRQKSKKINQLQPGDFDRIGDLYQVITGDLPPPVRDKLEEIGVAIRQATSPLILSIDMPLGTIDENNQTIADTLVSLEPQPDVCVEIQDIQSDWRNICNCWFSANIQPRDQQMLYLRYHCHLKQGVIESIIRIDQATVAKRLRKIHLGLARILIQQTNPESSTNPIDICKLVVEMLQESFDRLSIAQISSEDQQDLAALVQIYREQKEPALAEKIRTILERLWN